MKALMALLLLNTLAVFQAHAACTREVTVIELRADEVACRTELIPLGRMGRPDEVASAA